MSFAAAGAAHVPPLMTSGSLCPPLPTRSPTTMSNTGGEGSTLSLTTSYEDVASAAQSPNNTLIARGAVIHSELASIDVGSHSIIRRGAVVRPPIHVYANQATARIPDGAWLLPKTFVPSDAVLAPYTVYQGIPACPVEKRSARSHQLLHLAFLRELRTLAESSVVH